jgi:hypothetical protein
LKVKTLKKNLWMAFTRQTPSHPLFRKIISSSAFNTASKQGATPSSALINKEITMSSTGIAVGLKKGYPVEKRAQVKRPSNKKGVSDI